MTEERSTRLKTVIAKRQPGLAVVLENVFDPHHVSAVMRTCDAVGVQDIYILNTKILRYKKWGARSSSGAVKWLSVHQFENAGACFETLKKRYEQIFTTYLSDGAIPLYDMDLAKNIALVFGNEHSGVSNDIRELADGNFMIPQAGVIKSLNISVACAITLYEAYRQKNIAGHYNGNENDCTYKLDLQRQWGIRRDDR
jgi:tRNA (guanosine-2'-O-)-methyltransferase